MEEKKKFDLKTILTMDINDLFKKKVGSSAKQSKVKKTKLMMKPVVSFDFGSESIKVVEGRYFNGQLKVMNYFSVPTQGTLEDGCIVNEKLLIKNLEAALKEHKVKAKHAICTLNSTQIINRELFVPVVEEDELDTVVRFEIQQFLPINLSDYLIQYVILDQVEVNGEPRLKLNVVTFPEKMAATYYKVLKEVGLKPYALDVTYNALGKLANHTQLLNEVTDSKGAVAFVDMGAQSIDLNIFTNGNVQFTRLIKSGGSIIDERLNQLPDMSIKSAASLKKTADLNQDDMVSRILRVCVDEMMYELERVLQFYRNKSVGNQIDHIFILGGCSNIKGLEGYMSEKLSIPTSQIKALRNVEFLEEFTQIHQYANAIGALIRL
ncbi:MAG: type IV pilus assembly protein PilM [Turicibacter sp.]|nr:type IV pilus assembly protein PilM [Turicibacter sp.]